MSTNTEVNNREGGLYVHIPFCKNKCLYCDFYTGGVRIARWNEYVDSLLAELVSRENEMNFEVSTLYLGGGTPSLMPPPELLRLVKGINKICKREKYEEFTIEVNPEDVTDEKIKAWRESGINRISLGVQTLDDGELKKIGRRHSKADVEEAYNKLTNTFDNISLDVMFGIPGQTIDSYRETLKKIIQLSPSHISSYSLMLEEGTAMTLLAREGKIILPGEDEWIEMARLTNTHLQKAGYIRYETSNYAKPGKESRHNLKYWKGNPYMGLGPGAHSYDGDRVRRGNPNDLKGYIDRFYKGGNMERFFDEEILGEEEMREEILMTRLRMKEGLDLREYYERFGEKRGEILVAQAENLLKTGFMKLEKEKVSLTDEGYLISDSIILKLLEVPPQSRS